MPAATDDRGSVDRGAVPDFIAVAGREGEIVGYVAAADLLGEAPGATGLLVGGPHPDAPMRVYGFDLQTLVGHMVAGVGFVPLGDPLPPAIPVETPGPP